MSETPAPGQHDNRLENFLAAINSDLQPRHDAQLSPQADAPPSLHIIGAPRSGTTLLNQVIARCIDVGYINNLIAAFWSAPLYGIQLSQMLLRDDRPSSFESDWGRTSSIAEPHEFGYFWRAQLGYDTLNEIDAYDAKTDWDRARVVIDAMTTTFAKPVVFKSLQLTWQLAEFHSAVPHSCFVWVRRPLVDNALSILRLRDAFFGDRTQWVSLRPADCEALDHCSPADQAVRQVLGIEASIQASVALLAPGTVLEVSYERLCNDPIAVAQDCSDLLGSFGQRPDVRTDQLRPFAPTKSDMNDPDYDAVVEAAEAFVSRRATGH